MVSIPHRFNSHTFVFYKASLNFMFQSLTGSIHTLLGKAKLLQLFRTFQSLTGSIHTKVIFNVDVGSYKVSIPHRFNSHSIFQV